MLTLGFLGRLQWFAKPFEVSAGVVQISVQTGAKQSLIQVIVMGDVASRLAVSEFQERMKSRRRNGKARIYPWCQ